MAEQYVRQYASFRGVDFSSDPSDVADYRVAYAENMWRDYQNGNGDMIETIPGFRAIARELESAWSEDGHTQKVSKEIYGLHQYRASIGGTIKDYIIVHIGRSLYFKDVNSSDEFVEMESGKVIESNNVGIARNFMGLSHSTSVMSNNKLLIIDGNNIVTVYPNADAGKADYASTELTASVVFQVDIPPSVSVVGVKPKAFYQKAYEPITYMDGEAYEQPNIFSEYAIERFNNKNMHHEDGHIIVNDDSTVTYQLISISEVLSVSIDGVKLEGAWGEQNAAYYDYNKTTGKLVINKIKTTSGDLNATEANMKNRVITVDGTLKPLSFFRSDVFLTFDQANEGISAKEAVTGCTSIAVFDGKVFLTGNPKLPNMVFFTSTDITGNNNPTYFGIYNWLNTGVGMTPNVAMTASGSVLMVYKGDTVQDASVYYLSPYNTDFDYAPRFYTVTEGASGIGCIGGAFNFMDDPVFISRRGLEAIGKLMTNQERSIVHRSTNVDKRMLAEDLTKAKMAQWQGYLVIMVGSRMYLADSRAMYADEMGNTQYEWFFVDGIGSYNEAKTYHRYRYMNGDIGLIKESLEDDYGVTGDDEGNMIGSYEIKEGYSDEYVSDGASISWDKFTKDGQEVTVYYTSEEETDDETQKKVTHYYLVYKDDEVIPKSTDTFYEPKEICVINDVLYFATDNGDVLCFNTDKRGEIPDSVYRDGKLVDVDYDTKADFVGVIPQEYYTFDGRRYRSGVITKTDNAGISYATKNTINRSLVLRCGADPRTHSTTVVEVLTDRNSVFTEVDRKDTSEFTTAMTDFSALTFNTYPFAFLTYREKERKWVEKRYKIYNDAYRGILRIHSLSYRYEIGGKIK